MSVRNKSFEFLRMQKLDAQECTRTYILGRMSYRIETSQSEKNELEAR